MDQKLWKIQLREKTAQISISEKIFPYITPNTADFSISENQGRIKKLMADRKRKNIRKLFSYDEVEDRPSNLSEFELFGEEFSKKHFELIGFQDYAYIVIKALREGDNMPMIVIRTFDFNTMAPGSPLVHR